MASQSSKPPTRPVLPSGNPSFESTSGSFSSDDSSLSPATTPEVDYAFPPLTVASPSEGEWARGWSFGPGAGAERRAGEEVAAALAGGASGGLRRSSSSAGMGGGSRRVKPVLRKATPPELIPVPPGLINSPLLESDDSPFRRRGSLPHIFSPPTLSSTTSSTSISNSSSSSSSTPTLVAFPSRISRTPTPPLQPTVPRRPSLPEDSTAIHRPLLPPTAVTLPRVAALSKAAALQAEHARFALPSPEPLAPVEHVGTPRPDIGARGVETERAEYFASPPRPGT